MIRLWADFNEIYDDTHVWTSIRPSLRRFPDLVLQMEAIDIGEWVLLFDGEGNQCWALIEDVELPIIRLKLDLDTWESVDLNLPSERSGVMSDPEFTGDFVAS